MGGSNVINCLSFHFIMSDDIKPIQKVHELQAGHVYLLPVSAYPLPAAEAQWVRTFSEKLIAEIKKDRPNLRMEVIIRQGGIYTGLLDHFVENASRWMPEQGLAIIPHRPPPHIPTQEEMENIDPRSLGAGDRPPAFDFMPELIFRINNSGGREEAFRIMGGHSALHVFLTEVNESDLISNWKEVFGATVRERIFRAMPLFVPLFGIRSFSGVPEEKIISWLASLDLYIGESLEDNGIVIVSGNNIDNLIGAVLNNLPALTIEPEAEILRW
jgi:hypothetical protein